jgi:hypothetical protein
MGVKAKCLIPAAALVAFMACGGRSSSPSSPSKPVVPPPPAPSGPAQEVTLSGRILEVLPDGTRRPIGARQVAVEVDVATPTDPKRGGWIPVDSDGSYRLAGVPDDRFVKIVGVDTTGFRQPGGYRLCGTNTITHGDTTLDVPLFLPGATLPTPTLSGRVFVSTQGATVPLAGADVYYASRAYGPDVWATTDRDGQYSLCGVPSMPGTLYMFCRNETLAYSQAIDIRTDTVRDIDATPFYTCLPPVTSSILLEGKGR